MGSFADLIEPGRLRALAGEYLERAGEVLRASGAVHLMDAGPQRITSEVEDGGVRHATELVATPGGLTVRCDCPGGAAGGWCPHTVATVIESWQRPAGREG